MNGRALRQKAFAKINLALDILGRRQDGYHEVRMVMQQLELSDILEIQTASEGVMELVIEDRRGSGPGVVPGEISAGPDNLVCRAAALLLEHCGRRDGVSFRLVKNIPSEAGLGGGSADAAAAMLGLNELLSLGRSQEELCRLGAKAGADVPFCILGGTALAEGIGEILTPLETAVTEGVLPVLRPGKYVLLAKPARGLSTPVMFRAVDDIPAEECLHPDVCGMWKALQEGEETYLRFAGNTFEAPATQRIPEIGRIREQMLASGAAAACMSGSGPTVFGIFPDRKELLQAEEALRPMLEKGELSDLIVTGFRVQ